MSIGPPESLTLERLQSLAEELSSAYEELLAGEWIAAPAHIREVVAEWTGEVLPRINRRIIRCHDLVRRGLRDEAIQYAHEPPDLFEAVKLLDLGRFGTNRCEAWREAGEEVGIVFPPPPDLDRFDAIVDAENQLLELRPLLESWRRLNIRRAPLEDRIRLLRKLHKLDASEVWRAMLATHEPRRLTDIKLLLERAREDSAHEAAPPDLEKQLEAILAELQAAWETVAPPTRLAEEAAQLVVETRNSRIDPVLDAVAEGIVAAHARLNADRRGSQDELRHLIDRWHAILQERGAIAPDDPRLGRVAAIVDYIARLDRHERHLAELAQRAAEEPATLKARRAWAHELTLMLDRIDDDATRLPREDVDGRRIDELSDRVARITAGIRREERGRGLFVVATMVAVVAVVAGAAWVVFSISRHQNAVRIAVAEAEDAVGTIEAGGEVPPAFGDGWSEALRSDPAVAAAIERVDRAADAAEARRREFADRLAQLDAALVELQAADRPDPLAVWPEPFARASRLLAAIRENQLAVTDEEQAKLERPESMLRSNAKTLAAAADDAFEDQVRRLEADIVSADLLLSTDLQKADDAIESATVELRRLRTLAGTRASPSAAEGYGSRLVVAEAVASRVAADSKPAAALNDLRTRRTKMAGLDERERAADRLLEDGLFAEYADAIRAIATDLGSSPLIRDYEIVADTHAEWQAIEDWRLFLAKLGNPLGLTAERASEQLGALRQLAGEVTRMPFAKQVIRWLEPELVKAEKRTSDKLFALRSRTTTILESYWGEQIDSVVWSKQQSHDFPRYYHLLEDRPLPEKGSKYHKYLIGLPDRRKVWPKKAREFDPDRDHLADSPQKTLAISIKAVLEKTKRTGPEGTGIDRIALEIVATAAARIRPKADELRIDEILQAILTRYLLQAVCPESEILQEAFAESLASITNTGQDSEGREIVIKGVDNAAYEGALDPDQQDSNARIRVDREKCRAFLDMVDREATVAARSIEDEEEAQRKHVLGVKAYRCVGRLRKRSDGRWFVSGGSPDKRAGKRLFRAGGVLNSFDMIPCLTSDEKGEIPAGTDVNGRAGEPVFIELSRSPSSGNQEGQR